jgi:hypothetical protein
VVEFAWQGIGDTIFAALTDRKAADRQLSQLQASLAAGDLIAVAEGFSAGVSASLLTRLRERKLILRVPIRVRKTMAEILLRAAGDCLDPAPHQAFDRYLRFSLAVDAARQRSLERVHVQLRQMPRCFNADLLALGEAVFDWYAAKVMHGVDAYSIGASVAERERRFHDFNGARAPGRPRLHAAQAEIATELETIQPRAA